MYYENAKCFISKIHFLESTKDHGSDLMRKIFVSLVNPTDIKIFSSSPNWNRQHSRQLDQICCFIQDISVKTKISNNSSNVSWHSLFTWRCPLPSAPPQWPPQASCCQCRGSKANWYQIFSLDILNLIQSSSKLRLKRFSFLLVLNSKISREYFPELSHHHHQCHSHVDQDKCLR